MAEAISRFAYRFARFAHLVTNMCKKKSEMFWPVFSLLGRLWLPVNSLKFKTYYKPANNYSWSKNNANSASTELSVFVINFELIWIFGPRDQTWIPSDNKMPILWNFPQLYVSCVTHSCHAPRQWFWRTNITCNRSYVQMKTSLASAKLQIRKFLLERKMYW